MKKLLSCLFVIAMVALVASNAFAAGPLRSVGIEAGYVNPDVTGMDGTWTAGAFLDFGLPMTNLVINPFINYWNWSQSVNTGLGSFDTSFHDWSMGANLKLTIPTATVRVQPFVAAGVSAHMLNASVSGFPDATNTKFGFQTGAGLKVGISQSANIIGSGWYNMVSDVNHWSLRGGLAWNI